MPISLSLLVTFFSVALAASEPPTPPAPGGTVEKKPGQPAFVIVGNERRPLAASGWRAATFEEADEDTWEVSLGATERLRLLPMEITGGALKGKAAGGDVELPTGTWTGCFAQERGQVRLLERFDGPSPPASGLLTPQISPQVFRSAPASLRLATPGEAKTWGLDPPIDRGTIQCWFFDTGELVPGLEWTISLVMAGSSPSGLRELAVVLGWSESHYRCRTPAAISGSNFRVPRRAGWRKLSIDWSGESMAIAVDGSALLVTAMPIEPVAAVRASITGQRKEQVEPAGYLDDLVIRQERSRRPAVLADPNQDTLETQTGDVLFGKLTGLARGRLDWSLAGRPPLRLAWDQVQRVRLADKESALRAWSGEVGRLIGAHGNCIVSLIEADQQKWVIEHPVLGRRELARSSIALWQPIVIGEHRELRGHSFHLGTRFVNEYDRPLPDGPALAIDFTSSAESVGARIGVEYHDTLANDSFLNANSSPLRAILDGKEVAAMPALPTGGSEGLVRFEVERIGPGKHRLELRPSDAGARDILVREVWLDVPKVAP